MRRNFFEEIIIGATIGLAVMAIRTLIGGATAWQALALVLAGTALCGIQLLLLRRPPRAAQPPAEEESEAPRPAIRARSSRRNPFAHELTRNWTGLDDPTLGESAASAETAQSQRDKAS
jgi:hypothetical protein